MAEVIITEFMDDAAVGRIAEKHDVVYDPDLVDDPARLMSLIGEAKALIVRNRTQVRDDILVNAESLICVGRLGVGLDNIDVAGCEARGIAVYPATGANDLSVAEYVIATAMMLLRGAYGSSAAVAQGTWPRNKLIGRELSGKTLGLIGCGAIARMTAQKASALGMKIIGFDPHVDAASPVWNEIGRAEMTDLLAQSDVISLHVPLTDGTRNMIGVGELNQMKSDAIIINAARGGVIDETALAKALTDGAIGGAALDVFETEPLKGEQAARFAAIENVILTPHIAGVTHESNVRVSDLIATKILDHLKAQS